MSVDQSFTVALVYVDAGRLEFWETSHEVWSYWLVAAAALRVLVHTPLTVVLVSTAATGGLKCW